VAVLDPKSIAISGTGLEYIHVGRTAIFSLNMTNIDQKKLAVKILGNPEVVQNQSSVETFHVTSPHLVCIFCYSQSKVYTTPYSKILYPFLLVFSPT